MSGYFSKIIGRSQLIVPHRGRAVDFGKKEGIIQQGIEPTAALAANKDVVEKPGEQSPVVWDTSSGKMSSGPVTDFTSEETNSPPLPVIQKPSSQDFPNHPLRTEHKTNADPKEITVQAGSTGDDQKKPTANQTWAPVVHGLHYPAEKNIEKFSDEKKDVTKLITDKTAPVATAVKKNPIPIPVLPNSQGVYPSPAYSEKKRDNPKLVIGKITVEVTGPPAAPVKTTRQKNNRYTAPGMPKTNTSPGFKLSFGLGQL